MKQASRYREEVQKIVSENNEREQADHDTQPLHTNMTLNEIDVYVAEDRITLIPKRLHGIPINEQDIIDRVLSPQHDLFTLFNSDPILQAILQENDKQPRTEENHPLRLVDTL